MQSGKITVICIDVASDRAPCQASCQDFFSAGGGATHGAPNTLVFNPERDQFVYNSCSSTEDLLEDIKLANEYRAGGLRMQVSLPAQPKRKPGSTVDHQTAWAQPLKLKTEGSSVSRKEEYPQLSAAQPKQTIQSPLVGGGGGNGLQSAWVQPLKSKTEGSSISSKDKAKKSDSQQDYPPLGGGNKIPLNQFELHKQQQNDHSQTTQNEPPTGKSNKPGH